MFYYRLAIFNYATPSSPLYRPSRLPAERKRTLHCLTIVRALFGVELQNSTWKCAAPPPPRNDAVMMSAKRRRRSRCMVHLPTDSAAEHRYRTTLKDGPSLVA